jgi:tetratricopeptide (TPR) repeat protein
LNFYNISSLDNLPKNLINLSCYNNKIVSIENIPKNIKSLKISHNQIKIIDLTGLNNLEEIAGGYNSVAYVYSNYGQIDSALKYNILALQIREKTKNNVGISQTLNNLGNIFENRGDIPKAIETYYENVRYFKQAKNQAYDSIYSDISYSFGDELPYILDSYLEEYYNLNKQRFIETYGNTCRTYNGFRQQFEEYIAEDDKFKEDYIYEFCNKDYEDQRDMIFNNLFNNYDDAKTFFKNNC